MRHRTVTEKQERERAGAERRREVGREPEADVASARLGRAVERPSAASHADVLGLQRTLGNRATTRLVQGARATGTAGGAQAGVEALSGQSLDDVSVHYNSSEPARLRAHAFTKGSDVHLAPGQERHLPHELWHVAQQKQGRVSATGERGGVRVNRDPALEREADEMGARAESLGASGARSPLPALAASRAAVASGAAAPAQLVDDDWLHKRLSAAVPGMARFKPKLRLNFVTWLKQAPDDVGIPNRAAAKNDPETYIEDASEAIMHRVISVWRATYLDVGGPELKENQESDVPVQQGGYLVAREADLEEGQGIYTSGAGPCVIVAIHMQRTGQKGQDIFAISHFDAESAIANLPAIYQEARQQADQQALQNGGYKTDIYVMGGIIDEGSGAPAVENELKGPQLFEALSKAAQRIADEDASVSVSKRRTIYESDVAARVDASGVQRFKEVFMRRTTAEKLAGKENRKQAWQKAIASNQPLRSVHGGDVKEFGVKKALLQAQLFEALEIEAKQEIEKNKNKNQKEKDEQQDKNEQVTK